MAKILITSGPTRQFLDPVRYLTNASSGRMGAALAQSAIALGHKVTVVSGPVSVEYPAGVRLIPVITTDDMLAAVQEYFPSHDGLIGAAAPCDYMPKFVSPSKLAKDGEVLTLKLIETVDIVASAAATKAAHQWVVGFALETEDQRFRAIVKMQRKCCDLMVSNGPTAINSLSNEVEILSADGSTVAHVAGTKEEVADAILRAVQNLLYQPRVHE